MKNYIFLFSLLLMTAACRESDLMVDSIEIQAKDAVKKEYLSEDELNIRMDQLAIKNKNRFNWKLADDEMLYAGLKHAQDKDILMVGYGPQNQKDEYAWDLNQSKSKEFLEIRAAVLKLVFEIESKSNKKLKNPEDLVIAESKEMPNFDLTVTELETIQALRKSGLVRYMEVAYIPENYLKDDGKPKQGRLIPNNFGCGRYWGVTGQQRGYDYYERFGQRVSWQLYDHEVMSAWNTGATGRAASGKRFTIGYIDTGLSSAQPIMNQNFASGSESAGRQVYSFCSIPDGRGGVLSPEDDCGHGTCSASIGTSPAYDNKLIGVAFKANLVSVKGAFDVVLSEHQEYRGVANAFSGLGSLNVDIISMSMGTVVVQSIFTPDSYTVDINTIIDGVKFAKNRNKIIFCAAGTLNRYSYNHPLKNIIIFPANMNEDVWAVTGVTRQTDFNSNGIPLNQYRNIRNCTECFHHPDVDFGVVNEKFTHAATNMLALQKASSDVPTQFGGSSSATAMMSAMVLSVWSRYPTLTDDQIMRHIIHYSTHPQNRDSRVGHGLLNMYEATRYATPVY